MSWQAFLVAGLTSSVVYLGFLSKRLQTNHPTMSARSAPTPEEYKSVSHDGIDMLRAIPPDPTHLGYAIIGGSGFVGLHLIRLLLLRGETSIRILDVNPPPQDVAENSAISFIKTDVTVLSSLQHGLSVNFASTGKPPEVVFHMAAIIRFWERTSYAWPLSYEINVQGTKNVLQALTPSTKILIYTSSADLSIPRPKFWALGYNWRKPPYNNITVSDSDPPLGDDTLSQSCYVHSKRMAENLVRAANDVSGPDGLKTSILRPGCTIIGVNDRLISSVLTMPRFPVFDSGLSGTFVNVWDVASSHLLLEDALRHRPDEVAGQSYLVTGPHEVWTFGNIRNSIQHYSTRQLIFDEIPPLIIYLLAHGLEALLFIRYYLSLPFFALFGRKPAIFPHWLGEAVYLQPCTLDYCRDVIINDDRAREVLRYNPQWTVLQTIKNVVVEFESGRSGRMHGLQLRQ